MLDDTTVLNRGSKNSDVKYVSAEACSSKKKKGMNPN